MKIRNATRCLLAGILFLLLFEVSLRSGKSIPELRTSGKYDEIAGIKVDGDCNPFERLYPHPHFAYIVTKDDQCENILTRSTGARTEGFYTVLLLGGDLALKLAPKLEAELNLRFRSPTKQSFRVLAEAAPGWKQPIQTFVLAQKARTVNAVISVEGHQETLTILEGRKLDAPPELYYFITRSKDYDGSDHRSLLSLKRKLDASPILRNSAIANRFYIWKKHRFEAKFARESRNSLLYKSFDYPESWSEDLRLQTSVTRYADLIDAFEAISELWGLKMALFFESPVTAGKGHEVLEVLKAELKTRKLAMPWMTLSQSGTTDDITGSLLQKLAKAWGLEKK